MRRIYTTVGVYGNGTYKTNGVSEDDLELHIKYNLDFRPGRAFFVEGKCINKGYFSDEEVLFWTEKIKNIEIKEITAPYV